MPNPASAAGAGNRFSPLSRLGPSPHRDPTQFVLAAPSLGRSGTVQGPRGEYRPRSIGPHEDIAFLRRAREKQHFVLFYGPPGTGKTAACEAAFEDIIVLSCTEDTTVGDLLGEYVPAPPGPDGFPYRWVYKKLVQAMTEGRPILLDDLTLADPRVLSATYPALDGRGKVSVDAHEGEVIEAQPGYFVIACHNPSAPGARLSPALASRFKIHCEMLTDYDLAQVLGVKHKIVEVARALDLKRRQGEVTWAPQMRELLNSMSIVEDFGDEVALRNIVSLSPDADREVVDAEMKRVFGRSFWPLAVGAEL